MISRSTTYTAWSKLLMQIAMLVLMLLSYLGILLISVLHIQWFVIIVQKLGTFNWIVFLIPGCRKQPFRVNDKGNVLLLYLLDRHTQLQITAVARWLFRRENTFDFAGERGRRVDVVVLSTFLEYTYFSRLVKVIIRILQPFFMFFFHYDLFIYFFNLLNFYPVTRFLVTPLLVTTLLCLVTPGDLSGGLR